MPDELAEVYRRMPIRLGEGIVGGAAAKREPVQVPDIQDPSYQTRYRELLLRQGIGQSSRCLCCARTRSSERSP